MNPRVDRSGLIHAIAGSLVLILGFCLFMTGINVGMRWGEERAAAELQPQIDLNAAEMSVLSDRIIYLQEMFSFEGTCSWYGVNGEHGRIGANNKRFDMFVRTMATKFLPFNKMKWRVIRLDNGATTTVESTDDGPNVKGRLFDLSYGAAMDLGMIEKGIVRVRIVPEY